MARMVQCPKCKAILQEPPPGNPYYKCGSCFTVLQAKHATGVKPGLQGTPLPLEGSVQLSGVSKQDDSRRSFSDDDGHGRRSHNGAEVDHERKFIRQNTMPSRLSLEGRRLQDEAPATTEAGNPAFLRRNTMPGRPPSSNDLSSSARNELPSRASVMDMKSGFNDDIGSQDGVRSKLLGQAIRDASARRESMSDRETSRKHLPNYVRQQTLPIKFVTDSEGHQSHKGSYFHSRPNSMDAAEHDFSDLQQKRYQRQSTMKMVRLPAEADDAVDIHLPTAGSELPLSFGPGVRAESPKDKPKSRVFERQKTMPASFESEEPVDFGEEEDNRYRRQRTLPLDLEVPTGETGKRQQQHKEIPARLKALLDRKPIIDHSPLPNSSLASARTSLSHSPGFSSKSKDGVVVPARLQQLLDKKPGQADRQDALLPARLRALLDKKSPNSATRNTGRSMVLETEVGEDGGKLQLQMTPGSEDTSSEWAAYGTTIAKSHQLRDTHSAHSFLAVKNGSISESDRSLEVRKLRSAMKKSNGSRGSDGEFLDAPEGDLDEASWRSRGLLECNVSNHGHSPTQGGSNIYFAENVSSGEQRQVKDGASSTTRVNGNGHHQKHFLEDAEQGPWENNSARSSLSDEAANPFNEGPTGDEDQSKPSTRPGRGYHQSASVQHEELVNELQKTASYPPPPVGVDGAGQVSSQGAFSRGKSLSFTQGVTASQTTSASDYGHKAGITAALKQLPPPDAPQVVQCQSCAQVLAVPPNLPPSRKGVQKLRCGKCKEVSLFSAFSLVRLPSDQNPSAPSSVEGSSGPQESVGPWSSGEMAPSKQAFSNWREEHRDRKSASPAHSGRLVELSKVRSTVNFVPHHSQRQEVDDSVGDADSWKQPRNMQTTGGPVAPQADLFERQVFVNNKPIPDQLLEKAEKKAGPIYPGEYWYDVGAGFWGVMGGPCLGIIPPYIKELGSAMAVDCAGGDTQVMVNGRELHRNDLRLLMRRGLPNVRGGSYLIDVHGHVTDELSGQQLRSLGKLAPSLEGKMRGSGMYVP